MQLGALIKDSEPPLDRLAAREGRPNLLWYFSSTVIQ